jgi:hypothetical protein
MTTGAAAPAERILRLAAFAADRCDDGATITLDLYAVEVSRTPCY